MATRSEAAAHIFLAERRFAELVGQRVITRAVRDAYDIEQVRREYIEHIRGVASGRVSKGALDPPQERARKDRALAIKAEIENDVRLGNVVLIKDVIKTISSEYSVVRSRLIAISTKVAPRAATLKDAASVQALIDKEVRSALAELSDPVKIAASVSPKERGNASPIGRTVDSAARPARAAGAQAPQPSSARK